MSARYLLDTDWVIHYLNAHAGIVQRVDACRADGIAVSIATVAELYEGVYGSTDPAGHRTHERPQAPHQ